MLKSLERFGGRKGCVRKDLIVEAFQDWGNRSFEEFFFNRNMS